METTPKTHKPNPNEINPQLTFRTRDGFKRWACTHNMAAATGDAENEMFVENRHGELFVVKFDPITGKALDATLHRDGVSHQLGSNTLATLIRMCVR